MARDVVVVVVVEEAVVEEVPEPGTAQRHPDQQLLDLRLTGRPQHLLQNLLRGQHRNPNLHRQSLLQRRQNHLHPMIQ